MFELVLTNSKCKHPHDDERCDKCGGKLTGVWTERRVPDGRTIRVLSAPCCRTIHILCTEQVSYPHRLS